MGGLGPGLGGPPRSGFLLVPQSKVRGTRRWTHISSQSLPVDAAACPTPLSPSAWTAWGALRVGPAPLPRLRPAPRGSAPSWRGRLQSRGSRAERPRPHVERLPAPPRTQPSVARRGAANPGREKAEVPPLRGPGERGEPQKDTVCGPLRSRLFLERRRRRRERTLVSSPASGPVALPDSRPGLGGTFPSEPSRAGRGRLFGLSIVLLIRKDGRETTQRGGGPSGGGFVIPSFPPVLLSRTHLPTPPLGTQHPGEFYTG